MRRFLCENRAGERGEDLERGREGTREGSDGFDSREPGPSENDSSDEMHASRKLIIVGRS